MPLFQKYKRANSLLVDDNILSRLSRDMTRMCHLVTHRLSQLLISLRVLSASPNVIIYVAYAWRVARYAQGVRTA